MGLPVGYPDKPCSKEYDASSISMMTILQLKSICDMYGVQIEMTLKPTGIKIRFIYKYGDDIKKREISATNKELVNKINNNTLSALVYDVLHRI